MAGADSEAVAVGCGTVRVGAELNSSISNVGPPRCSIGEIVTVSFGLTGAIAGLNAKFGGCVACVDVRPSGALGAPDEGGDDGH